MPKMNPYRLAGPDMHISLLWAAGVFEAAARVNIVRNVNGALTSTKISAVLSPAVGIKMQELLGGSYSGHRWRVPPPEHLHVCSLMLKYVIGDRLAAKLGAIMAFRRTLGKRGIVTDPSIIAYRERLAARILACDEGILPARLLPPMPTPIQNDTETPNETV